jgi:hypothetical protein
MKTLERTLFHSAVLVLALATLAPPARSAEPSPRYAVVYQKDYQNQESHTVMSETAYRTASLAARNESAYLRKALSGARSEWNKKEDKRVGKKSMADYLNQNSNQNNNKQNNKWNNNQNNNKQNNKWNNNKQNNRNGTTFKKTERTVPFPKLDINMSPTFRCLALCSSVEEANTKREAFEARAASRFKLLGGSLRSGGNMAPSQLKRPPPRGSSSPGKGPGDGVAKQLFEKYLEQLRRGETGSTLGSKGKTRERMGGPIKSILK